MRWSNTCLLYTAERAVVGDILLHDDGAELFVAEDMAEFILMNFLMCIRDSASSGYSIL